MRRIARIGNAVFRIVLAALALAILLASAIVAVSAGGLPAEIHPLAALALPALALCVLVDVARG